MKHDLTLTDGDLTLRPLREADIPALCALATRHAAALRLMGTPPNTEGYYRSALVDPAQMAFVIEVEGQMAGSTRYGDIRPEHAGLEIGWTWLAPEHCRSGVNRRMKRLMLAHAFEVLGMERVQLKTDLLNTRSQRAIEGLGAVREGVLRSHTRRADGTLRDTVMYSVTRAEWPGVRARLEGEAGPTPLETATRLEKAVWDAFQRGDAEADRRLLAPDFLGVYLTGRAGRDIHAAQLEGGPVVESYALIGEQVKALGPGLLLLSYRAEFTVPGSGETHRVLVTSIWERRGEGWVNVFSRDTASQDGPSQHAEENA